MFAALLLVLAFLAALRFVNEENYGVAALCFFMLAAPAAFIRWGATRASAAHNPAVDTLLERPQTVTVIAHDISTSSNGGMKLHWLYATTPDGRVAMQLAHKRVLPVARALANHCQNAELKVPGLEPRVPR